MKEGREAWVKIADSGGNCYELTIVEKQAMTQEIKADEVPKDKPCKHAYVYKIDLKK